MSKKQSLVFLILMTLTTACGSKSGPSLITGEPLTPRIPDETQDEIKLPEGRPTGSELSLATDLYGSLIISEGDFYSDTRVYPWAGSWLPLSDNFLFKDAYSPLQKYDQYVQKTRNTESKAAELEKAHFYIPDTAPWAGRCDAWALASLMEPEPSLKKPVTVEGVTFSTTDLKALLTLTYGEVDGIKQFGQRYNGDYQSIAEDIYPEQFHKVLQQQMFEEKRPIIMDKDAGIEVWSTPIYKVDLRITKDATDPHLMHVHAGLVGGQPSDQSNLDGIQVRRNIIFEYTYDLYGNDKPGKGFEVVYGVWTGNSIKNHPDFIWILPTQKVRKSLNQALDVAIVDEIIERARLFDR